MLADRRLRPFIVVTGALHAEGGELRRMETTASGGGRQEQLLTRRTSKDRRKANVLVSKYIRLLHRLRTWKTPFGTLIDPVKQRDLDRLLDAAAKDVAVFNRTADSCFLLNCMVAEALTGARRSGVEGYLTIMAERHVDLRTKIGELFA